MVPASRPHSNAADVYLISYPKAGRTWLRALVGKALVDRYGLPEEDMYRTRALTAAAGLPMAAFDHDGSGLLKGEPWQRMSSERSFYRGRRVLLLGRDVRDNVVSAYFQATRRINVFTGPISEFVRHPAYGVPKILAFYRIWDRNRHVPDGFDFVRYEDLHRDAAGVLARVLAFLGADVPPSTIAAAVEYCRFENMRRAEAEGRIDNDVVLPASRSDDPDAQKVRRGRVGGYVDYLSPEDIGWIDAAIAAHGCEFTRPAAAVAA